MWYSERLDALWVGGGISSVKASASVTQFVVQPWMASAGASLGGSCQRGEYIRLACGLTPYTGPG